jgi:hypothetical protein
MDEQANVTRRDRMGTITVRPDRAGKVAMTTIVPRRFRKLYEGLKAELDDATMQELQFIALRAFLSNFRVPRAGWQAKLEALRREFGNKPLDGFGED